MNYITKEIKKQLVKDLQNHTFKIKDIILDSENPLVSYPFDCKFTLDQINNSIEGLSKNMVPNDIMRSYHSMRIDELNETDTYKCLLSYLKYNLENISLFSIIQTKEFVEYMINKLTNKRVV